VCACVGCDISVATIAANCNVCLHSLGELLVELPSAAPNHLLPLLMHLL
jgi:hypothetical protein